MQDNLLQDHPYIHTYTNKHKCQPHVPQFVDIFYRKTHLSSLSTCIQPNVNASQAFALQLWHWKLVQQLNCVGSCLPPHHHSQQILPQLEGQQCEPTIGLRMICHWKNEQVGRCCHLCLISNTDIDKFLLIWPNLSN